MAVAETTPIAAATNGGEGDGDKMGFAFVGSDQRIHAFLTTTSAAYSAGEEEGFAWQTADVLSLEQSADPSMAALPFPRPGTTPRSDGPVTTYWGWSASENGNIDFYVAYLDTSSHVQCAGMYFPDNLELIPGGAPSPDKQYLAADLTQRTGAPPAAPWSGITSYNWQLENSQHIVYVGTDGNIWELYYLGNPASDGLPLWQSNNLSERTGLVGPLAPKREGPLAATMFELEQTEHVVYIAGDNTIRELYFYNGSWGSNNLTEAASGPAPAAGTALVTYACNYQDTLHVFYVDEAGHLDELYWKAGAWYSTLSLDNLRGKPPAAGSDLAGYSSESDNVHHIIYTSSENEIIEVYYTGGTWNYTLLVGAPSPIAPLSETGPIAGYAFSEGPNREHIFYVDNSSRVHQKYRGASSWNDGITPG